MDDRLPAPDVPDEIPHASPDLQVFDCPRCGAEVIEPFYGPCDECREALRG